MESLNPDLEKEINEFFEESIDRMDNVFKELGFDPKQVCENETEEFLRRRDELLKNFEHHLLKNCAYLKDLEENANLKEKLDEKISQLIADEQQVNKDLEELLQNKANLNEQIDMKKNLVNDAVQARKEVDRLCNENVKEEFIRLCRFTNIKFQWNPKDQKFKIVFLSDSSDVGQVNQINSKRLLENDKQYVKELRDHFKKKVQNIK